MTPGGCFSPRIWGDFACLFHRSREVLRVAVSVSVTAEASTSWG